MQVKAHRDDWEAEQTEKKAARASQTEAEARAALLMHQLQLLQARVIYLLLHYTYQ